MLNIDKTKRSIFESMVQVQLTSDNYAFYFASKNIINITN